MQLRRLSFVTSALALVLIAGCVQKSRGLSRAERTQVEPLLSSSATAPAHRLDVRFGEGLKLIGYDVSTERVAPGTPFRVTWHWKLEKELDDGWLLFTHVVSPDNRVQNEDGNGVIRRLYPPSRWREGEFVRDVQEITLPSDFAGDEVRLMIGLWKGEERLPVRGIEHDENRARVLTLPVDHALAAPTTADGLVSVRANRASNITIDGDLNETSWQSAMVTAPFVQTMSGAPSDFSSTARVLWDNEKIYIAFEVEDRRLITPFQERDDHLWEKDTVEVMFDPDGDGQNYFELQVSPRNKVFDTRYDTRRNPGPIGHADWNATIESAVKVRGTVDDDNDDQGYTVEMAIRWDSFAVGTPPAAVPSAGTEWRMNFYVMDTRTEGQAANGWSPPMVGDFHMPDRFGRILFSDGSEVSADMLQALGQIPVEQVVQATVGPTVELSGRGERAVRAAIKTLPATPLRPASSTGTENEHDHAH